MGLGQVGLGSESNWAKETISVETDPYIYTDAMKLFRATALVLII